MADLTVSTFRSYVEQTAMASLRGAMPIEEAKRIAALTALGFFTAMRTAKNPDTIINCTKESIRSAIATSVGVRLTVGTPNAPAYLVPQSPRRGAPTELQFRVNHRGWAILGYRAGFIIDPVPVGNDDKLTIRGASIELEQDPDNVPDSKADLRGVVVYITELSSGHTFMSWVPKKLIAARANLSRGGGIWEQWPVEMAMGAAIRYAVARGKLPIDTADVHEAMAAEYRADVIDATAEPAPLHISAAPERAPVQIPAALRTEPAMLPDGGDPGQSMGEQARASLERSQAREPAPTATPTQQQAPQGPPEPTRDELKTSITSGRQWLRDNGAAEACDELFRGIKADPATSIASWKHGHATLAGLLAEMRTLRVEVQEAIDNDARIEAEEAAARAAL